MKMDIQNFRVREGEDVDVRRRATIVNSGCSSTRPYEGAHHAER